MDAIEGIPEIESAVIALAETHCLAESDPVIGFFCTMNPNHEGRHETWEDGRMLAAWPV